jgi:methionine sulfoxide reductase heme-binding subunit
VAQVTPDVFLWVLARVAGLTAFAALAIAVLSGLALRTGVLDWVGSNRVLRSLHEYTTVLWMPMGALHVLALLLDQTARIRVIDVLVPFLVPYGTVAIGLGTLAAEVFVVVAVTGYLRRRIGGVAWQWVHRLSYAAFGLLFLHGLLGGSDFGDPAVSALAWATAGLLALLALARVIWGRLPA